MFKCDKCPATFTEDQVLAALKPEPANVMVHGARVHMVNGKRHLLHCPSCDKIHFFGFDHAKEPEPVVEPQAPDFVRMPVVDIIGLVLELIHDSPKNDDCRTSLQKIKDGIFIELPEDRLSQLCQIGGLINRYVPSGKTNDQIEDYWHQIRTLMTEVFASNPPPPPKPKILIGGKSPVDAAWPTNSLGR